MEFERVVKRRRMCRGYTDEDVTEEEIEAILGLASRFPSAGHTQPQEFIVVRDRRVKEELGHASLDQMFLADAPVVVAVVSDTSDRGSGTVVVASSSTASWTARSPRCSCSSPR